MTGIVYEQIFVLKLKRAYLITDSQHLILPTLVPPLSPLFTTSCLPFFFYHRFSLSLFPLSFCLFRLFLYHRITLQAQQSKTPQTHTHSLHCLPFHLNKPVFLTRVPCNDQQENDPNRKECAGVGSHPFGLVWWVFVCSSHLPFPCK